MVQDGLDLVFFLFPINNSLDICGGAFCAFTLIIKIIKKKKSINQSNLWLSITLSPTWSLPIHLGCMSLSIWSDLCWACHYWWLTPPSDVTSLISDWTSFKPSRLKYSETHHTVGIKTCQNMIENQCGAYKGTHEHDTNLGSLERGLFPSRFSESQLWMVIVRCLGETAHTTHGCV